MNKKSSWCGLTIHIYIAAEVIVHSCPPPNTVETFYLTTENEFQCKYTVRVEVSAAVGYNVVYRHSVRKFVLKVIGLIFSSAVFEENVEVL